MDRYNNTHKGIRFLVDTNPAGGGRFGYQAVVDGKRPLIGAPCGSDADAMAQGIEAAKAKIDEVLAGYLSPR